MAKENKSIMQLRNEHEINTMKLTHSFALKMATIISWAVVSCVILLGIFTVKVFTPTILGILIATAGVFGIITFFQTRSACI